MVKNAEDVDADFVIIDMSLPARPRLVDRIWNGTGKIGQYSKTLSDMASYHKWAMLVILPSTDPHWKTYESISAMGGTGVATLVVSKGRQQISLPLLRKNGIPYAVDTAQELAERAVRSRFYEEDATDRKYVVSQEASDEMKEVFPRCGMFQYELADFLRREDGARQLLEKMLGEDPKSSLNMLIEKRLGVMHGRGSEYADKVEDILTFGGELGNFEDSDPKSVANAIEVWARSFESSGISVDFEHCQEDDVKAVSRALGVDSGIAAALSGVPVDDIVFA